MHCKFLTSKNFSLILFSINSSKVYCKSPNTRFLGAIPLSINSSKVYCKYLFYNIIIHYKTVLIVAKCIVNNLY